MNELVSIVVPVYHVAQYLGECVDSLLAQTYPALEIILVDDGGKDGSAEICDRYARQDPRVRVIHKANGGAASARNAGLDAATGAYVCLVDADDVVDKDYVNHLLTTLRTNEADIAVCGFYFWSRSACREETGSTPPAVYDRNGYLLRFLEDWSCALLWNKIFRRSAIGSIRMEEGHRVDDEYFTYQVCLNSSRVAVSHRCLYRYRLRASSAMQDTAQIHERTMLDRVGYITSRLEIISRTAPELTEPFFLDALNTITRYWHHSKDMPTAQNRIRDWVNAHRSMLLKCSLPLRAKLVFLFRLYLHKPAITGEPNSIQLDNGDYFP